MNATETRFFCSCGRLLLAPPGATSVSCPTCSNVSAVPGSTEQFEAATAVLTRPAGATVGEYRIERIIGQGGMGTVYQARHVRTGTAAAVKLLHNAHLGRQDFESRFRREARALGQLQHPNVVRVLDAGVDGSTPYLVMELLTGQHLLERTRRGTLKSPEAMRLMLQAAHGLEAAAKTGITHRDIKPSNLVQLSDGNLKIADFGLAKAADSDSHLTVTGEILGTPYYMAPEQGRGGKVDHRSDLYSLGATFYHLLCGSPPFEADTPVAVIMKHIHEEPAALRRRASHVMPGLETVIHRLLQKNPHDRYQNYAALIADLERLGKGLDPLYGAQPPARKIQQGATTFFMPEDQPTELILRKAGTIRRAIALWLDLLLLEALWVVGLHVAVNFSTLSPESSFVGVFPAAHLFTENLLGQILGIATVFLCLAYFCASDAAGGRSFGKRITGLRLCRRNGADLGPILGCARTAIMFPALVLLSPTLSTAAMALLEMSPESVGLRPGVLTWPAGLLLLGLYGLLGRLGPRQTNLQDALLGAEVYRAQPASMVAHRFQSSGLPRPGRAAWLSLVPGLGLMYVGRFMLGLVFAALIVTSSLQPRNWHRGVTPGLWVLSAVLASRHAYRRSRLVRQAGQDDDFLHRQES